MIRFFAPDISTNHELPESESGHAVRVLRKQPGDEIEVVDGKGTLYRCKLLTAHPKHAALEILETEYLPKVWRPNLTIAIAPTKNMDRMEWTVEKLVEIGIDKIVPLRCERSERKDIKIERLEKIAVSAMKQSLKAILPLVNATEPFRKFIDESRSAQCLKFIAWCDRDCPRRLLAKALLPDQDSIVLIGPEGDFTPQEVAYALDAGFVPVTLGDNRLRTETAAIVAADTFQIINQLNVG